RSERSLKDRARPQAPHPSAAAFSWHFLSVSSPRHSPEGRAPPVRPLNDEPSVNMLWQNGIVRTKTALGRAPHYWAFMVTESEGAGPQLSEKAIGIDVDREPQIARRLGQRVEPSAQVGLQIELARRLHQQAKAVAAADDSKRCLGRAQHLDALGRWR